MLCYFIFVEIRFLFRGTVSDYSFKISFRHFVLVYKENTVITTYIQSDTTYTGNN